MLRIRAAAALSPKRAVDDNLRDATRPLGALGVLQHELVVMPDASAVRQGREACTEFGPLSQLLPTRRRQESLEHRASDSVWLELLATDTLDA